MPWAAAEGGSAEVATVSGLSFGHPGKVATVLTFLKGEVKDALAGIFRCPEAS